MEGIPSPIEVQNWPQAISLIVLIICVMVIPSVFGYLNNRTTKAAKVVAEEAKEQAAETKQTAQVIEATLTTNNGGSHVKDQLDRIEREQATQRKILAAHVDHANEWEIRIEDRMEALEEQPKRFRIRFF